MLFLKHATESSFLISIGVLFHILVAETAKERPPSDSLLYSVGLLAIGVYGSVKLGPYIGPYCDP